MAPTAETDEPRLPARDQLDATPPEDDVLRTARDLAEEAGLTAISAGTGAALRLLAAATSARAAIEVGTGTGVAALWL
ncbi:MAG TPA: methyltransferase, partial [Micromonosporaceae bacterium]